MRKTTIIALTLTAAAGSLRSAPTGSYLSYLGDGVGNGCHADQCNFIGASAGKSMYQTVGSGFYGPMAGAYGSFVRLSDAVGYYALGYATYCTNVLALGAMAGYDAHHAQNCVFAGKNAGRGANDVSGCFMFGDGAGVNMTGVHGRVDVGGLVYADRESGSFRIGAEGEGLSYSNGVLKVGEDSLLANGSGAWLPNVVETGFLFNVDTNKLVLVQNNTCYTMTDTVYRIGFMNDVHGSGGAFLLPDCERATRFDILVTNSYGYTSSTYRLAFYDSLTNLLTVAFLSGEKATSVSIDARSRRVNGPILHSFLYSKATGLLCWAHREDDPWFSSWRGGTSIRLGCDDAGYGVGYGSPGAGDNAVSIGSMALAEEASVAIGADTHAYPYGVAVLGEALGREGVAINGYSYGLGGVAINTYRPGCDYLDNVADMPDPDCVHGQFVVGVMDSPTNFVFDIYEGGVEYVTNFFVSGGVEKVDSVTTNELTKVFSHTMTLPEVIREYSAPNFSDAVATNALTAKAGVVYDVTADKDGLTVTLPKRSERAQSFVVRLAPSGEADGTKIAGVAAATDDETEWKVDWLSGVKQTITTPCYYTFVQTAVDRWAVRAEVVDEE